MPSFKSTIIRNGVPIAWVNHRLPSGTIVRTTFATPVPNGTGYTLYNLTVATISNAKKHNTSNELPQAIEINPLEFHLST